MISRRYAFVYVHYPKTGGNTIQTLLLPFSDDRKVTIAHQDGADRFGVVGPETPEKHAPLQAYADRLGGELERFQIATSVRHPFERFVSAYFSPHKWMREISPGRWAASEPYWDESLMTTLLHTGMHRPLTHYLACGGVIVRPQILVRYESFAQDLRRMIATLKVPLAADVALPIVNASLASHELRAKILASVELKRRIEDFYRSDMDYFSYASYAA